MAQIIEGKDEFNFIVIVGDTIRVEYAEGTLEGYYDEYVHGPFPAELADPGYVVCTVPGCDNGWHSVPSMLGYGYDTCKCMVCDGKGQVLDEGDEAYEQAMNELLLDALLEEMAEQDARVSIAEWSEQVGVYLDAVCYSSIFEA